VNLLRELKRRNVYRAAALYAAVGWLLVQIATQVFPFYDIPNWAVRLVIAAVLIGFPIVLLFSWFYEWTPQGLRRDRSDSMVPATTTRVSERSAAGDGNSDVAAEPRGVVTSAAAPGPPEASVAILPFADLSPTKDQDWFCDGLAEEIIDALCCVRRLRVASRTASFRYRDGSVDPREIGRQLRVGAILEGGVRKSGERLRITAQLIDAASGFHLWSETWDRRLEDVFAIQTEIARKVSAALRVSLTGDEVARHERYAPRNMRAHEFYLRGRQLVGKIGVAEWRQAPALFRRAIELDPEYAQAYAGLADVLAQLLLWRFARAEDVLPEATRAAHRALELAPNLAEVHVALGHVRSLTGDNEGATRSFERALELNQELFEAHYYFARHCLAHGEYAHAVELFRSAFALRPDDYTVPALAVAVIDRLGKHADAEAMAREALDGLKHQVELDPGDPRANYLLAGMFARLGQREAGLPYIEAALHARPDDYATLYNAACYYSVAGDSERAIDLLKRACESGGGSRDWIEHDGDLDSLRNNPRFQKLIAAAQAAEKSQATP
jgi:adenylate cyclase